MPKPPLDPAALTPQQRLTQIAAILARGVARFGGLINEKTGQPYGATTRASAEWAAQQGKPVLTDNHYELIHSMARPTASRGQNGIHRSRSSGDTIA